MAGKQVYIRFTDTRKDAREFSEEDFAAQGIDHPDVRWDAENKYSAEVSEEVAKWLEENQSNFTRMTPEEVKAAQEPPEEEATQEEAAPEAETEK